MRNYDLPINTLVLFREGALNNGHISQIIYKGGASTVGFFKVRNEGSKYGTDLVIIKTYLDVALLP